MIIDVTGVLLTPEDNGENCMGNGEHYDQNGNLIEICCDECDYMLCCIENACLSCKNKKDCPKNKNRA